MLTISQLASYVGVTVRAVRHYHKIGLLPEPERDASGYRRYGARAVVALVKIRALADAGVPLSQIDQMLEADSGDFAAASRQIDRRLQDEIQRLESTRRRIAQLAQGDSLVLPPAAVEYLERLRRLGVSEVMIEGERDGYIVIAARWPELIEQWMESKLSSLEDPRVVRLYRTLSQIFEEETGVEDPRLVEMADLMAELNAEAQETGWDSFGEEFQSDVSFDLLDAMAMGADPRVERTMKLMRERGWNGIARLQRLNRREEG